MKIYALLSAFVTTPVWAEGLPLPSGANDTPVNIEADTSIVCNENEGQCIATGNAVATRGTFRVTANKLILHFQKNGNSHDAQALSAHGNVVMSTPNEKAYGDHANYNLSMDRLKITGRNLKLQSDKHIITADDAIEYWRGKQQGIARGNAVVILPQKKQLLKADTLTAHFKQVPGKGKDKQELDRIDAVGHVLISSPEETATATEGTYSSKTQLAELKNNVKLTKGENQIEGGYATFNLKTNVSQIFGGPPGAKKKQRIHGLIIPKDAKKAKGSSLLKRNKT